MTLIVLTGCLLFSLPVIAKAKNSVCSYEVKAMTCASSEATIKEDVNRLKGFQVVIASNEKSSAEATFDPAKKSSEKNPSAIEKSGYTTKLKQCKAT